MNHSSKHRIRKRQQTYYNVRNLTIRPANISCLIYSLILSSIIISVCEASWFGKGNPFLAPFLPRKSATSSTVQDDTNQEKLKNNPIENDDSPEQVNKIQQESSEILANDNVNEKIDDAKLTSNSENVHDSGTNRKPVNIHDGIDETTGSTTAVGVKEHSNNNNNNNKKKSNAVGDPDGSDDDDSDDEDEFNEEWEELFNDIENEMKDLEDAMKKGKNQDLPGSDTDTTTTTAEVQLEVEYVTSDETKKDETKKTIKSLHDKSNEPSAEIEFATVGTSPSSSQSSGGGIGLRMNQNNARDVLRRGGGGGEKDLKGKHNKIKTNRISKDGEEEIEQGEEVEYAEVLQGPKSIQSAILNAWQRHVFLPPPSPAMEYLQKNARSFESAGKMRLDRRTLYATLLQEFEGTSITNRKFLDQPTSQALQAALSLASQPSWRKSAPRPNGIRLYNIPEQKQQQPNEGRTRGSTTLAMQETISMALAHSLGAGYVAIDDQTIKAIRAELVNSGYVKNDDDLKPVNLLKSLISITNKGVLAKSRRVHSKRKTLKVISKVDDNDTKKSNRSNRNENMVASITKLMKDDISSGIDDPFDERASSSCSDMAEWEETWYYYTNDGDKETTSNTKKHQSNDREDRKLPLVIFLRTEACTSLLRSKSTVDYLVTECDSPDSVNLLVLGKGIGATTDALPEEPTVTESSSMGGNVPPQLSQTLPGAAPWFGFPPHNQNASGQNDPEGSRRFNIFLARTTDPVTGAPGIIGAIAPPQAGNLFPHMMAMQARSRLQQDDDDSSENNSPMRAELEKWAEMLQQQMQSSSGNPLPPPQFFNASFTITTNSEDGQSQESPTAPFPPVHLPPEVIQQTLEHAMSELLDRLSQMNDADTSGDMSPELQRAFSQVLRNESFRKGVAENLARAAPALSDPKCQGVLLSVYVPPPPQLTFNQGKSPTETTGQQEQQNDKLGGWFQKILNNQDDSDKNNRQKRVRTMAAAAAVMAAQNAQNAKDESKEASEESQPEDRAARNLARLESLCRPIIVKKPSDPVRAKSWDAWIGRERGSVIFRQNRRVLNEQLEKHQLSLQEHTGTRGAGSALRSMLSVRPIADEMEKVIECAIELEAAKSQRLNKSPSQIHEAEMTLDVDITLSQLLITDNALIETEEVLPAKMVMKAAAQKRREEKSGVQFLHPSSLEAALTMICRISPAPSGGVSMTTRSSTGSATVTHRTREEIAALAQDKHERALISQVVSPQDIGVTYDMIGGLKEVKELLRQSITYPLKFPHLYSEGIAREAVKGVLLFGPPGTGKTMLAKAVATEGGASFLSVDASSVENKWLGESEKNAKAVFTLARRLAPCVIFIDEVDSLLSSRDGTSDDSAHGTLTSVKTTMMSEWDGLNSGTNGAGDAGSDRVVVIGSTNRPFDLDEAVLRRFPRRILVDLPDLETRAEILEVTLAENRIDPAVNLTKIAERLEGYTGSDIKEVCREAVVQISHEQAMLLDKGVLNSKEDVTQGSLQRLRPVTNEDFEKALSKLKRSVSEKGRELARVWEWNDEYGEIKKEKKNYLPHLANMYL